MKTLTMQDIEQQTTAAIDHGNTPEINRLALELDRLDAAKTKPSILPSALWYAEQGLKVFPLRPGQKIPLAGTHGCKDATNDADQIRAWWEQSPGSNLGIATGHLVDVVDIDGPLGVRSHLDHWDMIQRLGIIGKVSTPRPGGMHLYVPASGKGNKAGLLPGIDYRGVGGYVVAPPSVSPSGRYEFLQPLDLQSVRAAA